MFFAIILTSNMRSGMLTIFSLVVSAHHPRRTQLFTAARPRTQNLLLQDLRMTRGLSLSNTTCKSSISLLLSFNAEFPCCKLTQILYNFERTGKEKESLSLF